MSKRCFKLQLKIFRHGDRAMLKPYPNDPYNNEKYFPKGVGHLTKVYVSFFNCLFNRQCDFNENVFKIRLVNCVNITWENIYANVI